MTFMDWVIFAFTMVGFIWMWILMLKEEASEQDRREEERNRG